MVMGLMVVEGGCWLGWCWWFEGEECCVGVVVMM